MLTVTLKFYQGGWVTVVMTGGLIALCYAVRMHYNRVRKAIEQLEADILPEIFAAAEKPPAARDPDAPTAVILVSGFNGLGLATLTTIQRLFGNQFRNVVFVGVAEVDSAQLKGPEEVERLEQQVADDLVEYCRFASDLGFYPELRGGIGPDVVLRAVPDVSRCGPANFRIPSSLPANWSLPTNSTATSAASCTIIRRLNCKTACRRRASAW